MTPTTLSDAELLRLLVAGNEHAFAELYRRHRGPVYRFALLMSGSANIAEEVSQEVFLMMIRAPQRYDSTRGALPAYLFGVARNQVLRVLRRERPFVPLAAESDEGVSVEMFTAKDDPQSDYVRKQAIKLVRQSVLALPVRYREVVVLCDFQELSCADAASVLGCPIGTINSRLHRGHALLLQKLRSVARIDSSRLDAQALRCFA